MTHDADGASRVLMRAAAKTPWLRTFRRPSRAAPQVGPPRVPSRPPHRPRGLAPLRKLQRPRARCGERRVDGDRGQHARRVLAGEAPQGLSPRRRPKRGAHSEGCGPASDKSRGVAGSTGEATVENVGALAMAQTRGRFRRTAWLRACGSAPRVLRSRPMRGGCVGPARRPQRGSFRASAGSGRSLLGLRQDLAPSARSLAARPVSGALWPSLARPSQDPRNRPRRNTRRRRQPFL